VLVFVVVIGLAVVRKKRPRRLVEGVRRIAGGDVEGGFRFEVWDLWLWVQWVVDVIGEERM
jgi:hypothetical protein